MTKKAAPRNVPASGDTQAGDRTDTGRRVWSRPRVRLLPVEATAQEKNQWYIIETTFPIIGPSGPSYPRS